ncbi:unnamed protein product [Phyllotreta striolata]|uniref:Synaptojanin-1/2 RNA recognition motif domain-containing protein n=1 Tax=Phyllotreta striolata TaxID=444603 RepID=A0A9N9TFX2_PHYSR|nr:unnamed protein product [Phyllotreta striolata]
MRQKVFYEVIAEMGPPDSTLIVNSEGDDGEEFVFDDNMVMTLLEEFSQFGETTLVRFVGDTLWITFREGQMVLEALKKTAGKIQVNGVNLCLSLKTSNWIEQTKEEIKLCSCNATPLYVASSPSDYNCLGIPEVRNMPRSVPPSRPPPPSVKPTSPISRAAPPKARVISMPLIPQKPSAVLQASTSDSPPNIPPPDLPQEESVYEEISDDVTSAPEPSGPPPPPPPRPEANLPPTPSRGPPPVPARSAPPPPLPARPRQ